MNELLRTQAFGIMLALFLYILGGYLYRLTKIPLFNPLLFSATLLMVYVSLAKIEIKSFLTDLSGINVFMGPLIVSLAVPIAKQRDLIKKNLIPILIGTVVGSVVSIGETLIIGHLLKLDDTIIASLVPKSTTTAIAIEISTRLGGIRAITVAVVVLTAVIGAAILPFMVKLFKMKDPRMIGLGLGSTAHAVGTAKALEIDPIAGALSGIALVISGITTSILTLFL
ncbi:MAG: LrgB family protein [Bacilli bacterium]|nr:LrgB family protein [Bacilli bacterium]